MALHLRDPAPAVTFNSTMLGFGLALLGIFDAWGTLIVTTLALSGLGGLGVALRFRAKLRYLGLAGLGFFGLDLAKLVLLVLLAGSTGVKILALLAVGLLAVGLHYLYNRFKEQLLPESAVHPQPGLENPPLNGT